MTYDSESYKYEPRIGEVVASHPSDFFTVDIDGFKFKLKKLTCTLETYNITLLRYVGNGVFTEMYTNRKILYAPVPNCAKSECTKFVNDYNFITKYGNQSYFTCVDFYKQYCILKDNPLFMGNFYSSLNEEIYIKIGDQEDKRDNIASIISTMFNDASQELRNAYQEREKNDTNMAYGENVAYDFVHDITRKRILKENLENKD